MIQLKPEIRRVPTNQFQLATCPDKGTGVSPSSRHEETASMKANDREDESGPAFLRAFASTDKVVTFLLSSSAFSKISLSPSHNQRERFFCQMTSAKGILGNRPAAEQQDAGQLTPVLCSQYSWGSYIWLNAKPKFVKTDRYLGTSNKRNSTLLTTLRT